MLFKPEHVQPILEGIKTETRRCWKKKCAKPGAIHKAKLLRTSKSYFALLHIDEVYQEKLGNLTDIDAIHEGYGSREEYIEKFKEIYHFWDPDVFVWVVKFHLVNETKKIEQRKLVEAFL